MSAFFYFQHTLNSSFNNSIKLYWYWISFSLNMNGGSNWPPEKLPSKSPALLELKFIFRFSSNLVINTTFLFVARANDTEEKYFLEEIELMKSIGFHKNIVNLIGASTQMKPLCLVLEYMPHGDLLHYLRKKTHVSFHRFLISLQMFY